MTMLLMRRWLSSAITSAAAAADQSNIRTNSPRPPWSALMAIAPTHYRAPPSRSFHSSARPRARPRARARARPRPRGYSSRASGVLVLVLVAGLLASVLVPVLVPAPVFLVLLHPGVVQQLDEGGAVLFLPLQGGGDEVLGGRGEAARQRHARGGDAAHDALVGGVVEWRRAHHELVGEAGQSPPACMHAWTHGAA